MAGLRKKPRVFREFDAYAKKFANEMRKKSRVVVVPEKPFFDILSLSTVLKFIEGVVRSETVDETNFGILLNKEYLPALAENIGELEREHLEALDAALRLLKHRYKKGKSFEEAVEDLGGEGFRRKLRPITTMLLKIIAGD